jgi:lysophospholipase L1-like esterase
MQWYEAEVHALEENLRAARLPARPAVFYGSSSIRMWSSLASDLADPRALNLGFGGSTLAACAYFFDRLVPPVHPASLVVYAGDNDLGDGRSPEDVLAAFRDLAAQVERSLKDIPFGFISIKLSPVRVGLRERITRANTLIRGELEKHPGFYYIDVYNAMLDAAGQPRPELFLEDGLHLSPAGYRLWTELLQPYRNRIFI